MNILAFTTELSANAIFEFKGEFAFLSNYSRCDIELDGETYRTVEHAYQAAKTLDVNWRAEIRNLSHPQWAKNRRKRVPIRDGWESMKVEVKLSMLRQKFAQPKFRAKLLATGDRHLFEANYWKDKCWGVCLDEEGIYEGENRLGAMLMQVRDELRGG